LYPFAEGKQQGCRFVPRRYDAGEEGLRQAFGEVFGWIALAELVAQRVREGAECCCEFFEVFFLQLFCGEGERLADEGA
jgi:hypothetical protein